MTGVLCTVYGAQVYLKKFRAHFHEALEKSFFQKLNPIERFQYNF